MKIKLFLLFLFYSLVEAAVIPNRGNLSSMVAISNDYINSGITSNILVELDLNSIGKVKKVMSYGDTQFLGNLDDVKSLKIEAYGAGQLISGATDLTKELKSLLKYTKDGYQVFSINFTTYYGFPIYESKILSKNIGQFLRQDILKRINKIKLDFNISDILASSVLDISSYFKSRKEENDLIQDIFPSLKYRGSGNWSISKAKVASYVLNLADNYTDEDLQKNYVDITKKWILLKDYFTTNNQVIAAQNCDKIIEFINKLAQQLDPNVNIFNPSLNQNLGESIIYGDANASLLDAVKHYYRIKDLHADENKILGNILKGELVYDNIQQSNILAPEATVNNENIKNLIWFLYALAIEKNQAFEEGTFLIEDPGFKLYDYLRRFGKERTSSHYKESKELVATQMGLDILDLPAAKGTILFGKVDNDKNLIFIKPENYGVVSYYDLGMHGWEFVVAQGRKFMPNVFGSDDQPEWRKERVPLEDIKKYIDITNELKNFKNSKDEYCFNNIDDSKLPINKMYANIVKYLKQVDISTCQGLGNLKNIIIKFKEYLEKTYDNLDIRSGREVILRSKDLNKFDFKKLKVAIAGQFIKSSATKNI